MIHKQGQEYKDSDEIEEVEVEEDESKKGKRKKLIIAVISIALVFVVGVPVVILSMKRNAEEPPVVDASGGGTVIGEDDYWSQFDVVSGFKYTAEEKAQLRAWGYTGDEIEAHEFAETPAADLIAASRQAQEEMRASLSNPESPEYLALLHNTWLGLNALTLPEYTEGETEGEIYYNTITYIADYEKVPGYGHSLYIKVYLEDGTYAFMECPLARYMQLADRGNIVVQYQTAALGDVVIVHSMKEVVVQ